MRLYQVKKERSGIGIDFAIFHESGTLRSVNQDKNGEVKMTVMTPDPVHSYRTLFDQEWVL